MSVYFLAHGDLIKIGYSSNLGQRVRAIMSEIPGDVAFLGYIPGDRELEQHLHMVFEASRFSGEWFSQTPDLIDLIRIVADKDMPPAEIASPALRQRRNADDALAAFRAKLRKATAKRWPEANHKQRVELLAAAMNLTPRRARSLYNGFDNVTLRQIEADEFAQEFAAELTADAEQMSPVELGDPSNTGTKGLSE